MLQAIRERVTGPVAFIILGFLAIPFLFFGVESYMRDMPQNVVARVGEAEITVTEFQTEFARYRVEQRQQQGENYDDLAINRPEVRREFLENMIEQRLLSQHAESLGLTVSPAALLEVIRSVPAFQIEGRFDPEYYRQRLRAVGQSPRQFEQELSRDLLLRSLPVAISTSTVVTPADVDRWLAVQQETRTLALVSIDSAPFRDPDAIDEAEIERFYADNPQQFLRPEQINLEFIELDTRQMADNIEVDEAQLRERYEAVKARYMTPERRLAAHILVTTGERSGEEARELAWSLHERLVAGEQFEALAREYSDDRSSSAQGGDLGWIEPGIMVDAFDQALFALQAGEFSEPVETEFGWHLIRLAEIEAPRGQSFEEARFEILAEVTEERADDLFYELSERMVDLIYADPTSLAAVASDLGLTLQTTGLFARGAGEGLAADPRIQQAAFSDLVLIERQASEPIELERNRAVVLRVIEHIPATPRELEQVREEIRAQLSRERAREAARQAAQALVAGIEAGEGDLETLAAAGEWRFEERVVTRRDFDLGSQLLDELFRLPVPPNAGALHVVPRGGGWTVVRLDRVTPGDPSRASEAERSSAKSQIGLALAAQEASGLLTWLKANTKIEVVEERIN